jgi:hypothetical protein
MIVKGLKIARRLPDPEDVETKLAEIADSEGLSDAEVIEKCFGRSHTSARESRDSAIPVS